MSDAKIQKLTDLETKKSVHISMTKSTHTNFRKKLFDYDLSMQEVIELFAVLSGENDERAIDIIRQAKDQKRKKVLKKFSNDELESLYDTISEVNPFA